MDRLTDQYVALHDQLIKIIDPTRVITHPLKLLAYGTDASVYRLIPKIVVQVHNEQEVIETVRLCNKYQTPVTFRAAGTSLSGQAVSDSVLLVATHGWKEYALSTDHSTILLQPGITGQIANKHLKPYGKKIGPDPASIDSAMIGGILANNASGMCCGTKDNSYQTVVDLRLVMYDGTVLDTSAPISITHFEAVHSALIKEIEAIRDEIRSNQVLFNRIKDKYKIKNTTGYSLNAFVDFEEPIEIIKHLMVGSEGTLAFISNVTYETIVDERYKACALVMFDTIERACQAVPYLKESPVSAVELLDRASIRSVEDDSDAPVYFKTLPETACALLIECQANESSLMSDRLDKITAAIDHVPTLLPYAFTSDPVEYEFNWRARKGLLSSVGGLRKTGTSCIIEDVAVTIDKLAAAALDIQALFKKYHYTDAVLFGHALDGNLHLTFSQDFEKEEEVKRYADMMNELTEIIVDTYDGSLKAEHGTGRNMAPFVEKEWGETAYRLMLRIKKAFDPHGLINPGVIINKNKFAHLEHLKPLPAVHELVDKCMECGFCEHSCVAEGLTLSPRQRIVVAREIAALTASGANPERLKTFKQEASYLFDETCATDGLCAIACPVRIDTGQFVKQHRLHNHSKGSVQVAAYLGRHIGGVTSAGRVALNLIDGFHSILGSQAMGAISGGMRTLSGKRIPRWNKEMPKGAHTIKEKRIGADQPLKVIYFPSCINRTMGTSKGYEKEAVELTKKTEELLQRAGYSIIYPTNINQLCCGMAFSSKGFKEEGERKRQELEDALYDASEQGAIPVLFDMSPCFYTFMQGFRRKDLKVYDPVEFMHELVMPKLKVKNKKKEAVIFPVCSVKKIAKESMLHDLAKQCAEQVTWVESNCCGFAGDRGFTYPELNEHGLRHLKKQVPTSCNVGYSTSRTCEIGMAEHSGVNFQSIFYLIDEVTR